MNRTPVSIVGVSGYAGAELARLVAAHPSLSLHAAVSDSWAGRPLAEVMRVAEPTGSVVVSSMADVESACAGSKVVLLATPADASVSLAPRLLGLGLRVVDLSGGFRLEDASAYPRWYGFEHPCPELLAEAVYGLPEVGEYERALGDARLVANPGCYATAAIVAMAPLLANKLVDPRSVFLDGKSGTSGAGKKVSANLMFTEVAESVAPYRVGRHQHTPEIEQVLSEVAGTKVNATFTPHLLPLRRGLIVTAYGNLAPGVSAEDLAAKFSRYYAGRSEVQVTAADEVSIARVAGDTHALVGAHADMERGSFVSVAAIDNLLKGAASQALQNLCAMVGVPFARAR